LSAVSPTGSRQTSKYRRVSESLAISDNGVSFLDAPALAEGPAPAPLLPFTSTLGRASLSKEAFLKPDSTVTIKTFSDQTAADVAAAELERAGIRYILVSNDASGMLPFLRVTGIKLMVDSKDAEEAQKILASP